MKTNSKTVLASTIVMVFIATAIAMPFATNLAGTPATSFADIFANTAAGQTDTNVLTWVVTDNDLTHSSFDCSIEPEPDGIIIMRDPATPQVVVAYSGAHGGDGGGGALKNPKNITLIGITFSNSSRVVNAGSASTNVSLIDCVILDCGTATLGALSFNGSSNNIVSNCTFSNSYLSDVKCYNSGADNNLIINNVMVGSAGASVYLVSDANNNNVIGNVILNSGTYGIQSDNGDRAYISNNAITNATDSGMYIHNGALDGTIVGNTVYGAQGTTTSDAGIVLDFASGTTIEGNRIEAGGRYAIKMGSSASCFITSNTLTNHANDTAIRFNADNDNTLVAYNTIADVKDTGVNLRSGNSGIIIESNNITATTGNGYGIHVFKEHDGIIVRFNEIHNLTKGLYCENSGGSYGLINAFISNNFIHDTTTALHFIDAETATNTVANNVISNNTENGVLLFQAGSNYFEGNVIDGSQTTAGIRVSTSFGTTALVGNVIRNTQTASEGGIYLDANTVATIIKGNTISNSASSGIYLYSEALVMNNTIASNADYGIKANADASNSVIVGNTIHTHPDAGARFAYGSNIIIASNYIHSISGGDGYGLYFWKDNEAITVKDNCIESNASRGIYATSGTFGFRNSLISNNTIRENASRGIFIEHATSTSNVIIANTIASNTGYGIHLLGTGTNDIIGNTLIGNDTDSQGASLRVEDATSETIRIIGNTIAHAGTLGIRLNAGGYAIVAGNTVTNMASGGIILDSVAGGTVQENTVAAVSARGIESIVATAPVTIFSNTVVGCGGEGVFIRDTAGVLVTTNTIANCTLDGVSVRQNADNIRIIANNIQGAGNGIVISNATGDVAGASPNAYIVSNSVAGSGGMGIYIGRAADNAYVAFNSITTNGGEGVYFRRFLTGGIIEQNSIVSNGADGVSLARVTNVIVASNTIMLSGMCGIYAKTTDSLTVASNRVVSNYLGSDADKASLMIESIETANVSDTMIVMNYIADAAGTNGKGIFVKTTSYPLTGTYVASNTVVAHAVGFAFYNNSGTFDRNNLISNDVAIESKGVSTYNLAGATNYYGRAITEANFDHDGSYTADAITNRAIAPIGQNDNWDIPLATTLIGTEIITNGGLAYIRVSWNESAVADTGGADDFATYRIFRTTHGVMSNITDAEHVADVGGVGTRGVTSYTDAPASGTYYYHVSVQEGSGNESFWSINTATERYRVKVSGYTNNNQPDATNLEFYAVGGTLSPTEAYVTSSNFIFRVIYTHPTNDAPKNNELTLVISNTSTATTLETNMVFDAWATGDNDYINGAYFTNAPFHAPAIFTSAGTYAFFVRAQAEVADVAVVDSEAGTVTIVNSPPTLVSTSFAVTNRVGGNVAQTKEGAGDTPFYFAITYKDAENDAPAQVGVVTYKQGTSDVYGTNMLTNTSASTYTTGETFFAETLLPGTPGGDITYEFSAYAIDSGTPPKTNVTSAGLNSVVVTITNSSARVSNAGASPSSGTTFDTFTFTAHYRDYDSDGPVSGVVLVLSNTNGETEAFSMTEGTGTYYNSMTYTLTTNLAIGTYAYHCYAVATNALSLTNMSSTRTGLVVEQGNTAPVVTNLAVAAVDPITRTLTLSFEVTDEDAADTFSVRVAFRGFTDTTNTSVATNSYVGTYTGLAAGTNTITWRIPDDVHVGDDYFVVVTVDDGNDTAETEIPYSFDGFYATDVTTPSAAVVLNNPYKGTGDISVANVPANAKVRVYTVSGMYVAEFSANGLGIATWDASSVLANVKPGIYILAVCDATGVVQATRKLIIAR